MPAQAGIKMRRGKDSIKQMKFKKQGTRLGESAASLNACTLNLASCTLSLIPYFCAMKILMVCLGNICRSPLAEGILEAQIRKNRLNWAVDSASTNGLHVGEAPHPLSQKVALQHGIDISGQRSRKFVADDFNRFDKIYAMAEDVIDEMKWIAGKKFDATKVDLLMNEVYPGKNRDVPDPWAGPESGYHHAYKMIDEACVAIIENYTISNKIVSR